MRVTTGIVCAVWVALAVANQRAWGADDEVPGTRAHLEAVRVTAPPHLDGRLDDEVWATAPVATEFRQQYPYGGAAPSEQTSVRVLYDDEAVYVGFDCPQQSSPIVHRLTRRDQDSESEWVWAQIDSRHDGRTAFFFAVNVSGVLADGTMDGPTTSFEWDENWEAKTALTANGWSAEMRIPLRVLRFEDAASVQTWGFMASRFIADKQERDDWPYVPREIAVQIPFFAELGNLRDLRRGGRWELRPFGLARLRHRDQNPEIVARGTDLGASAGLDLKVHLTQALTLDAAINPDFAQVEADKLVLNLNNYEISYPEKRPLFLEGAETFATPLNVFYSRRIGSSPITPTLRSGVGTGTTDALLVDFPTAAPILGAAKVIGRVRERLMMAALSALSYRNQYQVQQSDMTTQTRIVEPLSWFNVLRLRQDLDSQSHVGAILTSTSRYEDDGASRVCPSGATVAAGERCFHDALVGGLDAQWRSPRSDYFAGVQLLGSRVSGGQPEVQADGVSIGPGDSGFGTWVRLAKEGGQPWLADLTYTGLGRRITYNDLGFMPRQNLHELKAGLELRSLKPSGIAFERHLRLDVTARRTLDGLNLGNQAELSTRARLEGFWYFSASASAMGVRFDDREIGDGTALERLGSYGLKLDVGSDPRRELGGDIMGELRTLDGGYAGKLDAEFFWHVLPQLDIQLAPQISIETGERRFAWHAVAGVPAGQYLFGRLDARSAGATLRVGYTFTPTLTLQLYNQLFLATGHYSDYATAPATVGARIQQSALTPYTGTPPTDADFEQAALNVNVVLRWEYRLGSTLFLVYSRSQIPDVTLMAGEDAMLKFAAVKRVPAVDVVLLKLSFWWAS